LALSGLRCLDLDQQLGLDHPTGREAKPEKDKDRRVHGAVSDQPMRSLRESGIAIWFVPKAAFAARRIIFNVDAGDVDSRRCRSTIEVHPRRSGIRHALD
jgi:hypothetical protein